MNKEIIVHIAAEVAPYSKVGGLGDVVGCLPNKLSEQEKEIRNIVITPYYKSITIPLKKEDCYEIEFNQFQYQYGVYTDRRKSIVYIFIELDKAFSMDSCYVDGSKPYLIDVGLEYIFFGKCCIDYLERTSIKDYKFITHDWHAAGIYGYYSKDTKAIHVIHNYQHQGQLYPDIIEYFEPEIRVMAEKIVDDTDTISMNAFAIMNADKVVTVSENYAYELMNKKVPHPSLELFRVYDKEVFGILNGVDYEKWNPMRKDVFNTKPYSSDSLENKFYNKKKLKENLQLDTSNERPLVLILSRLTQQKGLDLIVSMGNRQEFNYIERMKELISNGYDIVICGIPAGGYSGEVERQLQEISGVCKENFRYINTYSDNLAHELLAGSDILLHISNYEPCGLTPMYAMKYGTVPVVSKRGGLVDIVRDYMMDKQNGNGFCVSSLSYEDLRQVMLKVKDIYYGKKVWLHIIRNCMQADFSWDNSARKYLNILKEL